jgi:2-dehydro-3-deoxygluconokinase
VEATVTDLATFGETMLRLSTPRGEPLETAPELRVRAAGAESNVAVTAARLGARATWVSKLPDSPLGRRVAGAIRSHGVEPAVAWTDRHRQGTYFLEQLGDPAGPNVVYDREGAAVTTATPEELPLEPVREASVVFTTGITPGLSDQLEETTRSVLETADESGVRTALDVNYRSKLWSPAAARESLEGLFELVDLLVVAERDARTVLDRDGDPREVANGLREAFGFETVVLTRGEEGALAVTADGIHRQSAFEAETLDPVGTGDAFVGGYLARRVADDDIPDALEYGAAVAALKRGIAGDQAVVAPADVQRVLEQDTGDGIDR